MIQVLLCIIIVSFSTLAGWARASVYSERVRVLTELSTSLKYLESEMGCRMEAIPVILKRIGEGRREKVGAFFCETAELLDRGEAESLWNAWIVSLDHTYGHGVLTPEDRRIIEELGYELGQTDMATQRKLFDHCYAGLALAAVEAKEEAKTKGKMYRGLGVSVGILTAVLLL